MIQKSLFGRVTYEREHTSPTIALINSSAATFVASLEQDVECIVWINERPVKASVVACGRQLPAAGGPRGRWSVEERQGQAAAAAAAAPQMMMSSGGARFCARLLHPSLLHRF